MSVIQEAETAKAAEAAEFAADVLAKLFAELSADQEFVNDLTSAGVTMLFVISAPDTQIFVSPGSVLVDPPQQQRATHTFVMSAATSHELWSGRLSFAAAVNHGRLRIYGPVAKVLELMPILAPVFERYSEFAAGLQG